MARVIPPHKKGSKCAPSNYRPVSILSALSKIFERIMQEEEPNRLFEDKWMEGNLVVWPSGICRKHLIQ